MKKKTLIFVLIGVLAACFIGISVFLAVRGVYASNKQEEYFDVYRDKAEEYIRSNPEIVKKYGEDISIEFDDAVTRMYRPEMFWIDILRRFFLVCPKLLRSLMREYIP